MGLKSAMITIDIMHTKLRQLITPRSKYLDNTNMCGLPISTAIIVDTKNMPMADELKWLLKEEGGHIVIFLFTHC